MDLPVCPGQEGSGSIWDINFGQESSRIGVTRVRSSDNLSAEIALPEFPQRKASLQAWVDRGRVRLRHRYVHAYWVNLSEIEHFFCRGTAIAGVDQRSGVDIALRNNSRKWSIHALERFHLLQPLDVSFNRFSHGCSSGQVAVGVVEILPRNGIRFD